MTRSKNILLLLLCAQLAQAQGGDALRRAERYLALGDAYNAALQYEQYLGLRKTPSRGFAPYGTARTGSAKPATADKSAIYARLAACYSELHDHEKAVTYYAQAGNLNDADRLNYVRSLRALGRNDEARNQLAAIKAPGMAAELELERAALNFSVAPDAFATVEKANGDLNTGHGNYAAVKSGSVVFFTSTRVDSAAKTKGPNRNHIYRIVGEEAIMADPIQDPSIDQGLCSFTPDGRRMFFTVWTLEGGRRIARIHTVTREDGGWTTPQLLDGQVNLEGSSNAQPCYYEKDGVRRLYFASNRAGGRGGYDLYVAQLDASNKTTNVEWLGSGINTAGDEQAPFYHGPSQTLVFTSNGRPGMGGFDLYQTRGGASSFGTPQNLGAPYNSVKDDSYFFSEAKDSNLFRSAFLSSDRESDCCLEVFSITRKDPPPPPPPATPDTVVPPPPPAVFSYPTVHFDFNKWELADTAKAALDRVAEYLQQNEKLRLRIGGYTDARGGEGYNDKLSDRRARAVRDYLAAKGIAPGRLWIKGFGECCPLEPEQANGVDDPEARAKNRRVELKED